MPKKNVHTLIENILLLKNANHHLNLQGVNLLDGGWSYEKQYLGRAINRAQ